MVTLFVNKVVGNFTNNNTSGEILFDIIKAHLESGKKVVISFDGISEISSSFVNSAFIELLEFFDFNYIKAHLSFIDSTKQMNNLIRDRFMFESSSVKLVNV